MFTKLRLPTRSSVAGHADCATVVPALHLSDAITSAVVLLTLLGFPIALVLAWAFELTPEASSARRRCPERFDHPPHWKEANRANSLRRSRRSGFTSVSTDAAQARGCYGKFRRRLATPKAALEVIHEKKYRRSAIRKFQ